jgi:hypothetical protein
LFRDADSGVENRPEAFAERKMSEERAEKNKPPEDEADPSAG